MGTKLESVDAQKGTMKYIFTRCLKKNKAQVCTLLKLCAFVKRNLILLPTLLQNVAGKPTSKIAVAMLLMHTRILTSKHPLLYFLVYKICHTITGVYSSQVKNKP